MATFTTTVTADLGPGHLIATVSAAGDPPVNPVVAGLPTWAAYDAVTGQITIDTNGLVFDGSEVFDITVTSDNGCAPAAVDTIRATANAACVVSTGLSSPVAITLDVSAIANQLSYTASVVNGGCSDYGGQIRDAGGVAVPGQSFQSDAAGNIVITVNGPQTGLVSGQSYPGYTLLTWCNTGTCAGVQSVTPIALTVTGVVCTPPVMNDPVLVVIQPPTCLLSATATPPAIAAGGAISYTLSIAGGSCSSWQTNLSSNDTPDDPAWVNGQGISSPGPGSYDIDTTTVPPGTYWIWARCNDGGACQDAQFTKRQIVIT